MSSAPPPTPPRRSASFAARRPSGVVVLAWATAGLIVLGTAAAVGPAAARPADPPAAAFCPSARHLVTPATAWRRHRLAPGIRFDTTTLGTGPGRLTVNVLRVDVGSRRVKVAPLHRSLTHRRTLSRLARRPHLVAATNASYFDYGYGAPTVPIVGHGEPLVMTRRLGSVAGIGDDGQLRHGDVRLVGRVRLPSGLHRLVGLNAVRPPRGLSVYTTAWGRARVPLPVGARTLALRHDRVLPATGRRTRVPKRGELVVATTRRGGRLLRAARAGRPAMVRYHDVTDASHPFQQAYGVGTHIVAHHRPRTHLYCRPSEVYAARTDIAWAHHGRRLILATVDSPRGSDGYGVDENQMAQIMAGLGAADSYALDGGGSTELVAKLPRDGSPTIRTDNRRERRIPVGIGVYALPHPRPAHHRHHKRHGGKGLLGGLLGGLAGS